MKLKYMDHQQLRSELMEIADIKVMLAMQLAEFCHDGSERHTLRPGVTVKDAYVMHPYRNALRSLRVNADNEAVSICILHDTVEDAPERIQEFFCSFDNPIDILNNVFGFRIADGVSRLTVGKEEDYSNHVKRNITSQNGTDAFVAKLMDLKDNAGSLNYTRNEKKRYNLASKYKEIVYFINNECHNNDSIVADLEKAGYDIEAIRQISRETLLVVKGILGSS